MLEQLSLFFLGGGSYAALELAWRGTTHWTMFAAGGACLCLLRVGHLCAAGRRKYRLSPSKFPVRQLKSKLSYRLSGILRSYQIRKAVHTMTQQFRYVGGHIEVFSESGAFLFSADTMQEAWEELSE